MERMQSVRGNAMGYDAPGDRYVREKEDARHDIHGPYSHHNRVSLARAEHCTRPGRTAYGY